VHQPKPSILIVENNNPTLELYRRELSRDFQVLACSEVAEAMTLVTTSKLEAVVLEPAVSNGQGWKLLSELRQFFSEHALPIILCSTLDERKRGQEAGAADFLVKPVLPSVLLETLQRVIRLSSKA
jgi:DNA-binding response OmpR family regulator